MHDVAFGDVRAEPLEVIAAAAPAAPDEPLKDANGNVLAYADVDSLNPVARMQATVSPDMDPIVRRALINGEQPQRAATSSSSQPLRPRSSRREPSSSTGNGVAICSGSP